MRRYILILAFGLLFSGRSAAQPEMQIADSVTYQLYLEKKWEQLLDEAKDAFKNKIDFYYLRVRAGVAAYELKKYREAVSHFQSALKVNPEDDFVNSYYYYALLISGREDEANNLADHFAPGFLKQWQIEQKGIVNAISLESLLSLNGNYAELLDENIETEGSFSNYRSLLKQQFYKGISLDLHILPWLNLYQNFSHISIDRTQQYRSTLNLLDTTKETTSSQYQYYISGRVVVGKGWSVSAAFTTLWGKSNYNIPEYVSPWLYNLPGRNWEISDYLISAGLSKEFTWLRPKVDAGFGEINRMKQFQANFQVVIYPLGNANLYFIPEVTLHFDESAKGVKTVFCQKAGLKTGPVWLTGEYAFGTIKNFYSGEGLVVYNMPESISNRFGINLWYPLFKYRLDLDVRYQRSCKEGMTFVYTDLNSYYLKPYNFTDHSILLSIKWNL